MKVYIRRFPDSSKELFAVLEKIERNNCYFCYSFLTRKFFETNETVIRNCRNEKLTDSQTTEIKKDLENIGYKDIEICKRIKY